jgi:hypothetical protein
MATLLNTRNHWATFIPDFSRNKVNGKNPDKINVYGKTPEGGDVIVVITKAAEYFIKQAGAMSGETVSLIMEQYQGKWTWGVKVNGQLRVDHGQVLDEPRETKGSEKPTAPIQPATQVPLPSLAEVIRHRVRWSEFIEKCYNEEGRSDPGHERVISQMISLDRDTRLKEQLNTTDPPSDADDTEDDEAEEQPKEKVKKQDKQSLLDELRPMVAELKANDVLLADIMANALGEKVDLARALGELKLAELKKIKPYVESEYREMKKEEDR